MSFRGTLARLVTGDLGTVVHEAIPELQKACQGLTQRAEQLRQHAELAPNQLNRQELSRLADEEQAEARRVAEAIAALGAEPLSAVPAAPPAGSLNHWGRLVQDLESHRGTVRTLREEAFHFAETLPDTAALFAELCRIEDGHAVRLRDLIARTDPQAID